MFCIDFKILKIIDKIDMWRSLILPIFIRVHWFGNSLLTITKRMVVLPCRFYRDPLRKIDFKISILANQISEYKVLPLHVCWQVKLLIANIKTNLGSQRVTVKSTCCHSEQSHYLCFVPVYAGIRSFIVTCDVLGMLAIYVHDMNSWVI